MISEKKKSEEHGTRNHAGLRKKYPINSVQNVSISRKKCRKNRRSVMVTTYDREKFWKKFVTRLGFWHFWALNAHCFTSANFAKSSKSSQVHLLLRNGAIWPIWQRRGRKKVPETSRKYEKKWTIGFSTLFPIFAVSQHVIKCNQMKARVVILGPRYVSIFFSIIFHAYCGNNDQILQKTRITTTFTKFWPLRYFVFLWSFMLSFNQFTLGTWWVHRGQDSIQISYKSD